MFTANCKYRSFLALFRSLIIVFGVIGVVPTTAFAATLPTIKTQGSYVNGKNVSLYAIIEKYGTYDLPNQIGFWVNRNGKYYDTYYVDGNSGLNRTYERGIEYSVFINNLPDGNYEFRAFCASREWSGNVQGEKRYFDIDYRYFPNNYIYDDVYGAYYDPAETKNINKQNNGTQVVVSAKATIFQNWSNTKFQVYEAYYGENVYVGDVLRIYMYDFGESADKSHFYQEVVWVDTVNGVASGFMKTSDLDYGFAVYENGNRLSDNEFIVPRQEAIFLNNALNTEKVDRNKILLEYITSWIPYGEKITKIVELDQLVSDINNASVENMFYNATNPNSNHSYVYIRIDKEGIVYMASNGFSPKPLGAKLNLSSPFNPGKGAVSQSIETVIESNVISHSHQDIESSLNETLPIALYTVTFADWNGSVLKTQTVNQGDTATPPTSPSRSGYKFIGWSGSYAYVTSDRTITALYEIATESENCTVTINLFDADTKTPITNMKVMLVNSTGQKIQCSSNNSGKYVFHNVPEGLYGIEQSTDYFSSIGAYINVSRQFQNQMDWYTTDIQKTLTVIINLFDNSTGASMTNVNIVLINQLSGKTIQYSSDNYGQYRFNNVPIGEYQVEATLITGSIYNWQIMVAGSDEHRFQCNWDFYVGR